MVRPAAPRRALVGFAAAATGGVVLSLVVASGGPILARGWSLLLWLTLWAGLWLVAVALAFRLPHRVSVAAVLVAATALRLAALAGPPNLSDDLYRYAWDGRVQAAGIDAYRYPPDDPALSSLREGWLWPDAAGCEAIERPPGCTRINRPHVRTIYPPVAEAWFAGVYRVAGIGARDKAWQVAALVADLALVGLLPLALRAWGRDPRWTALYALAPFPVVELVGNAHVDGLAALAVVAALVVVGRRRDRTWLAGVLVGAATLVKLYPALLVAAFPSSWRPGAPPGRGLRRWWPFAPVVAASGAVVALGYLPHVAVVGPKVVGYLPGYLQEEHYDEGSRFLLTSLVSPAGTATAVAAAALVVMIGAVLWRRPAPPVAAATLVGGLLLVTTPVQPWYAVTLLAVATVAARPAWAVVAAATYPYFFAVILDQPHVVAIGRLGYGTALVAVVADGWWRARGRTPAPMSTAIADVTPTPTG